MNIFAALVCLLWTIGNNLVVGVPQKELHEVLKGRFETSRLRGASTSINKYPAFELCKIGKVTFKAHIVYLSRKKTNIKLRVEALSNTNKHIESYEVDDYNIDPSDDKIQAQSKLKEENICNSFKVEQTRIKNQLLFKIKFYHDGEWWCDVYATYAFKYKDMDKCESLEDEYDAILDKEYNAVDLPLQAEEKLGVNFWDPCPVTKHPEQKLCINEYTDIETRVLYYCHNKIANRIGYKIVNYYKGTQLGMYTLTNSETIKGPIDGFRACRLFRFAMENNNANQIRTQYMNKGVWYCETFNLVSYGGSPPSYSAVPGYAPCQRFRDYQRPKRFKYIH